MQCCVSLLAFAADFAYFKSDPLLMLLLLCKLLGFNFARVPDFNKFFGSRVPGEQTRNEDEHLLAACVVLPFGRGESVERHLDVHGVPGVEVVYDEVAARNVLARESWFGPLELN